MPNEEKLRGSVSSLRDVEIAIRLIEKRYVQDFRSPIADADQAAVTPGNTDGEIAGLTFSNPPTQAECEALRDKCEELADDVRAMNVLLAAIRDALLEKNLIKGSA